MTPYFWHGKKVFITGHTGFKGSWLSLWLKHMGAEVSGLALEPDSQPALFNILQLEHEINSNIANVNDLEGMKKHINQVEPDVVFHMAAQALVKPSYDYPVDTFQTNIMGTVNLLEAVRENGNVKAVVVVTSDKCYENQELEWPYKENDRLGGHDPYSNSKACAELVTDSYRKSFFYNTDTAVATARAGNVIGGGDWSVNRLIPDIIRAKLAGQSMAVRNPESTRPWQHVLEPLSGYIALAEKLYCEGKPFAEAWNFGPLTEDIKPVSYLVDNAREKWSEFNWHTQPQPHHHEAGILMLDCTKSITKLGWQPKWSIQTALSHTLEWYDAYYAGTDIKSLCLEQIEQFSS